MAERETLETDVLIVGGGPAGLAAAIRLADLAKAAGRETAVMVIEKGREMGAHGLSGAVMDPSALEELIPGFRGEGAPVECEVVEDFVYHLTEKESIILPVTPPPLRNEGNLVISLAKLVRWLAEQAEKRGVDVFPEFPGVEVLVENDRVAGVRTGDKGLDKEGKPKANHEQGVDIKAKVTILAEGPRGHLTRDVVGRFKLDEGKDPQTYATGVKEVWEVPDGSFHEGRAIHTMGWPLRNDTFGGGFVYSMKDNRVAVGFVVGLHYPDPFTDPHHEFQRFKTHPKIAAILKGGKMVEYGAKTIPEGGWRAVPRLWAPGCLLAGDCASLLDAMKLKGVHHAIRSGMIAAQTALEALQAEDYGANILSRHAERVAKSAIRKELWKSRYFKHGFKHGLVRGSVGAALSIPLGGWSPYALRWVEPDHKAMKSVKKFHGCERAKPERIRFDDELTFGKMSDVYASGTTHNEDSPCHLKVLTPSVCVEKCAKEFGNPCQHFCPAGVYEWVKESEEDVGRLMINFSNCVHCKTCDVMDPYGIIRWVPPEGGGGPGWQSL